MVDVDCGDAGGDRRQNIVGEGVAHHDGVRWSGAHDVEGAGIKLRVGFGGPYFDRGQHDKPIVPQAGGPKLRGLQVCSTICCNAN